MIIIPNIFNERFGVHKDNEPLVAISTTSGGFDYLNIVTLRSTPTVAPDRAVRKVARLNNARYYLFHGPNSLSNSSTTSSPSTTSESSTFSKIKRNDVSGYEADKHYHSYPSYGDNKATQNEEDRTTTLKNSVSYVSSYITTRQPEVSTLSASPVSSYASTHQPGISSLPAFPNSTVTVEDVVDGVYVPSPEQQAAELDPEPPYVEPLHGMKWNYIVGVILGGLVLGCIIFYLTAKVVKKRKAKKLAAANRDSAATTAPLYRQSAMSERGESIYISMESFRKA
ncbi:hypothetical protein EJ08DRAFT_693499 [Tothia fuscella]|uniref:Uncharacterized protein n=1 Tax=Tothia fuscella TaxID=1048955 RepID=A0A9P4NZG8_9PEZI|nr:hypothetical protein EJ08DRAFT_693499 [Tothia fuscella]